MYKVNICSAIVILKTNMTGQVLTRTGSIYNEFFFSQVYHAAPFQSGQDGSSTVCIVNHMISSAIWNK